MPIINCDQPDYQFQSLDLNANDCSCSPKVVRLAFARRNWLDLESMAIDAEDCVSTVVMQGGEMFFELEGFDSDFVTFTQSFDSDNCRYDNALTIDFQQFSKQLRLINCNMQNYCDWVYWFLTSDCKQYIGGIENLGGTLGSSFKNRITDHQISIGGTSVASNAITIGGRSNCEIMQTTVDHDTLPVLPITQGLINQAA